jgi:hypothetical protein
MRPRPIAHGIARRPKQDWPAPGVLVILALAVVGCGPPWLDYEVVDLPSGGTFKFEAIEPMRRSDGRSALLLRYHTDLDLTDVRALESEVADVWEYFRPLVEAREMNIAVIWAAHWEAPSWERRGAAAQYVVERSGDGSWSARPDRLPTGTSS